MLLRPYTIADTKALMQLFLMTVHRVNTQDYTLEQAQAWAPPDQDPALWRMRLSAGLTLVAEDDDGTIIGFGSLSDMDFLDMMFVHPDHLRKGVGKHILDTLSEHARSEGHNHLKTMSSITALPFFKAQGFSLMAPHSVKRRGVKLENYEMTKKL